MTRFAEFKSVYVCKIYTKYVKIALKYYIKTNIYLPIFLLFKIYMKIKNLTNVECAKLVLMEGT